MVPLLTIIFYGLTVTITQVCSFPVPAAPTARAWFMTQKVSYKRTSFNSRTALVVFQRPRAALSTRHGYRFIRAAALHGAPPKAWPFISRRGVSTYEGAILASALRGRGPGPGEAVLLSTAADPRCLAIETRKYGPLTVTALVTAGAGSNAMRAGTDYGDWLEDKKVPRRPHGTINVVLIVNVDLTPAALARLIITVTEAKTAALQDLGIRSTYTPAVLATGTGTDEAVIVAGLGRRQSQAGGHTKLSELVARAVHAAVLKALIRQMKVFRNRRGPAAARLIPEKTRRHKWWPGLTCRACPRPE
jgi:adenosylcobinamide amidohydrolase